MKKYLVKKSGGVCMKRKWLTSDEMRHATHKPGECWENIAKFGNTPRWVVTTWAAVRAKADAEDTPPKYPRSTPEVTNGSAP